LALKNLGLEKGYTLVGCDSNGVNAFFCKTELISNFKIKNIQNERTNQKQNSNS